MDMEMLPSPSPRTHCPPNGSIFPHSACWTHHTVTFKNVTVFLSMVSGSEGILWTNCSLRIQPCIKWHSGATLFSVSSQALCCKHSWCCLYWSQYTFSTLSNDSQTHRLAGCKSLLLHQGLSVIKRTKSCQALLPHIAYLSRVHTAAWACGHTQVMGLHVVCCWPWITSGSFIW